MKEGKGVWRWGKREIIYLSLHCHHQNDSCIKMGSDGSHFNVSVGSDRQSHKTMSTNHNLFEEKGEPKRYRTKVLPLTSLTPYHYAKLAHEIIPVSQVFPHHTLAHSHASPLQGWSQKVGQLLEKARTYGTGGQTNTNRQTDGHSDSSFLPNSVRESNNGKHAQSEH